MATKKALKDLKCVMCLIERHCLYVARVNVGKMGIRCHCDCETHKEREREIERQTSAKFVAGWKYMRDSCA